jgi:hypothetical protein
VARRAIPTVTDQIQCALCRTVPREEIITIEVRAMLCPGCLDVVSKITTADLKD